MIFLVCMHVYTGQTKVQEPERAALFGTAPWVHAYISAWATGSASKKQKIRVPAGTCPVSTKTTGGVAGEGLS